MIVKDRRKMDAEWKQTVEQSLKVNTAATLAIAEKLDAHINAYDVLAQQVQPAITAIQTMEQGVRVIGSIGSFTKKVAIWTTAVGTAAGTVWAWRKGLWPPTK